MSASLAADEPSKDTEPAFAKIHTGPQSITDKLLHNEQC